MGSFEGDIGHAACERMAQDAKPAAPAPLVRRIEDYAVTNMKGIATGASAGIFLLAALVVMTGRSPQPLPAPADPVTVSSISREVRVPALPEWETIRKPMELLTLTAPQFERVPAQYAARRTPRNDREDSLLWQPSAPGAAEARISLLRRTMPQSPPSLFVDMTRQQAERGVAVTRAGAPGLLMTKFGAIEVADMTFSDASGASQACLAFRGAPDEAAPVITGWYCAAQGVGAERPELACFIDRLTLLKSGDDRALRQFFTEAEQRRRPCLNVRNSAGRKPTWLDHDGRSPAMRGGDDITGSIARPRR